MSPKLRWVIAIVGLLAANLIAMVILAITSSANAPQILPSYEHPARGVR
jgi:hypothetical protein